MTFNFLTLHELVTEAHRKLSANDWDFISGGTETETSLRRNRLALDSVAFRPRIMRDIRQVDVSREFEHRPLRLPLLLAPVGRYRFGGGPNAVARAAERFGCAMALSSVNQETNLEELAQIAPECARIYQLYVRGDAAWIDEQVDRAKAAGYTAFCITADTAIISRRERDIINNHMVGSARNTPDLEYQAAFNWDAVKRIRDRCSLPMILKGVSTAEDAALAVEHGFEYVYVSNHGGRQMDHAEGSFDALKEVLAEIGGRAKTIVDGAIYRGSDIVKAIALGADLVGIGRLHCYALAAAGESDVLRMLELLEEEVRMCMQLLGATRLSELGPACLKSAQPVGTPDLRSPFPLLADSIYQQ